MVNGYISSLKLVISCSQNHELVPRGNPQKRGKTTSEISTFALSWNKLNGKGQILGILSICQGLFTFLLISTGNKSLIIGIKTFCFRKDRRVETLEILL